MFALNLKTLTTVALVLCGIGYGAWAAVAGGRGDAPEAAAAALPGAGAQDAPPASPPTAAKLPPALQPFQGKWRIVSIAEGKTATLVDGSEPGEVEIGGNTLRMPYRDATGGRKHEEYKIAVDADKNPPSIDLIAPNRPVGKGIYQFTAPGRTCSTCHDAPWKDIEPVADLVACPPAGRVATGMKLAIAASGPRPTKFGSRAEGVIEFTLARVARGPQEERDRIAREKARLEAFLATMRAGDDGKVEATLQLAMIEVEQAKAEEELARHQVAIATQQLKSAQAQADVARVQLAQATQKLKDAEDRLAAAKKAAPAAPMPAKDGDSFTIHVRPLAAAEKVIRVKATGTDTVLEGLTYAAADMALKPDALSVWVVRGKDALPVDLAAILQKGDAKTNHILKARDQLFVQVNAPK